MLKQLLFLSIFIFRITAVNAQLPDSDLFLFELDAKKNGVIKSSKNITNRVGYDNQPSFSLNQKLIYYTVIKEDKQADVYSYKIGSSKIKQLTKTAESEYSPMEMEFQKMMGTVSVLKDSSQIIRFYDLKTFSVVPTQLDKIDSVGYYTFLNSDTVIYYKLTESHSLRFHSLSTEEDKFLANNPSRTFKPISRSQIIYGIKDSTITNYFVYDFILRKASLYASINAVCEDIIWHPSKGLCVSNGTKILNYNSKEQKWIDFYDLSSYGVKKITRFNFSNSGKYLVLVNNN